MALFRDLARRQFANADDIKIHKIYGVSWDKTSTSALTRTDASVGFTAEAGVDAGVVVNDFDDTPLFGDIHEVVDTLGNTFVRIPKFYIKKTDAVGLKTWQVSKTMYDGFYRPHCFWDFANSKELPYVDIGKYKASLGAGSKLESKPGVPPLVNTTLPNMRTQARNNNAGGLLGYQLLDIHAIDLIRTLAFVEFANLDIQSIMQGFTTGRYGVESELATANTVSDNYIDVSNATGAQYRVGQTISAGTARYGTQVFYGRTITAINVDTPAAGTTRITFDGAPVSITTGAFLQNTGAVNGFSAGIAASSGSIGDNSSGKYPCMYRGIESPFGDIWQFVDGVNISDWQAWVCRNAEGYASNVFASPYEQLSYVNHNANNYVQGVGYDANNPFAEFPTAVSAIGDSGYKDYYYQTNGARIALVGGAGTCGALAGVSYWALTSSSTASTVTVGGRLVRKCL